MKFSKDYYIDICIYELETDQLVSRIKEDYKLKTHRECQEELIKKGYSYYYSNICLSMSESVLLRYLMTFELIDEKNGYMCIAQIVKKKEEKQLNDININVWNNNFYGFGF